MTNFDPNRLRPRSRRLRGEPVWIVIKHWVAAPGENRSITFRSREDANAYSEELIGRWNALGESARSLPNEELLRIVLCQKELEKMGSTIWDATQHFLDTRGRPTSSITIREMCAKHLSALRLNEASENTLRQTRYQRDKLCGVFGSERIASIPVSKIADWLQQLPVSQRTRYGHARYAKTILFLAKDYGIEVEDLPRWLFKRTTSTQEINLPSIAELEQLLKVCLDSNPAFAVLVALNLFGGLRRSEVCQLSWTDFLWDENAIWVPARKAKTRQARIIPINPTLAVWLERHPDRSRPLVDFRHIDTFGARLRRNVSKAEIKRWPRNSLRHLFASHRWAQTRNEHVVASEMGSSPGVVVSHYRHLVTPSDAMRFWDLTPEKLKA